LEAKCSAHGKILLTLDQHRSQKTIFLLSKLKDECNATTVLVPPSCTSVVQPLDVVFNGPFKKAVDNLATAHVESNVSSYVHGSLVIVGFCSLNGLARLRKRCLQAKIW